jgi:hypothetical protein
MSVETDLPRRPSGACITSRVLSRYLATRCTVRSDRRHAAGAHLTSRSTREDGVRHPDFQNPTGRTLSAASDHSGGGLPAPALNILIGDDPYGLAGPRGQRTSPVNGLWHGAITTLALSQNLSPGIRLGYVVAHAPIVRRLELAKAGPVTCTAQPPATTGLKSSAAAS